MPVRRLERGFTLVELLIAMALLAILVRLAAPSFSQAIMTSRLGSYTNSFVASTQLARSEAVKRNAPVTLCRSADGLSCAGSGDWAQGWIVMCKATTVLPTVCNSSGSENLVLHKHEALASDYRFVTLDGGPYSLAFPASGVGATQAKLRVCRWNPVGNQEREIEITASGRTAVTTTTSGTCS